MGEQRRRKLFQRKNMKVIQGDKESDSSQEDDHPPAIDNDPAFDIQDQKIIEQGYGEDTDNEAGGYFCSVGMCNGRRDKGNEEEDR